MLTVTITGVASYFAKTLLPLLDQDARIGRIIGFDVKQPDRSYKKLEFHLCDIRDPGVARFVEHVDVVIHLAFIVDEIKNKALSHDINVGGTRNLLTCSEQHKVRKIIYTSSIAAYGSHPEHPTLISEETALRPTVDCYYSKDKAEVEALFSSYLARNPDTICTILRPCLVMGPHTNNMFTRFFSRKLIPTLKGKDIEIQFLHEQDLGRALFEATIEDHPGIYNVVPDEPIRMSELIRLGGSIAVPLPTWLAKAGANLLFSIGLMPFSQAWVSMQEHPICASNEKFFKEFGWRPRHSSREAVMEYLNARGNKG